jgi:hypothetical protein
MTIADLDSAEREVEQLDRRPPRRAVSADGDSIHLPLGQRMRKPERAEGEEDGGA